MRHHSLIKHPKQKDLTPTTPTARLDPLAPTAAASASAAAAAPGALHALRPAGQTASACRLTSHQRRCYRPQRPPADHDGPVGRDLVVVYEADGLQVRKQ